MAFAWTQSIESCTRGSANARTQEENKRTHACGTPERAALPKHVSGDLLVRNVKRVLNGEHVRLNDLVVEHDRVEGSVDAVVDVV